MIEPTESPAVTLRDMKRRRFGRRFRARECCDLMGGMRDTHRERCLVVVVACAAVLTAIFAALAVRPSSMSHYGTGGSFYGPGYYHPGRWPSEPAP